jgi:hypothetical protein
MLFSSLLAVSKPEYWHMKIYAGLTSRPKIAMVCSTSGIFLINNFNQFVNFRVLDGLNPMLFLIARHAYSA